MSKIENIFPLCTIQAKWQQFQRRRVRQREWNVLLWGEILCAGGKCVDA